MLIGQNLHCSGTSLNLPLLVRIIKSQKVPMNRSILHAVAMMPISDLLNCISEPHYILHIALEAFATKS